MPDAERILVVRAGALGDFLLGVPALRALRRRFPLASIHLAGPQPAARLAAGMGAVDSVSGIDDTDATPLFADSSGPTSLPERFRDCDLTVVWLRRPQPVASNLRYAGARRVLTAAPFPDVPCHVADWLLRTLEPLGIQPSEEWDATPWLSAPAEELAAVANWQAAALGDAQYAVLHPGSGSARKNWPAGNWAAVWRALRHELALKLAISAGPADEAALAALEAALGQDGVIPDARLVNLPLERLAGVLARASLYLGNDSGVSHLAAGLGTPTVAVFGVSDPLYWHPRGPRVRALGGPPVGVLPPASTPPAPRWPSVQEVTNAALSQASAVQRD